MTCDNKTLNGAAFTAASLKTRRVIEVILSSRICTILRLAGRVGGFPLAGAVLLGFAACTEANTDPVKSLLPLPTEPARPPQELTVPPVDSAFVLVLDPTTSTRTEYLLEAQSLVADALDRWLQPGRGGIEVAVTLINSTSYDPANEVVAGRVAGLPQTPTVRATRPRPMQPDLSSCRTNAFSRVKCEESLVDEYNEALAAALDDELAAENEHRIAVALHDAVVRQRAEEMTSLTDRIRKLQVPPDNKGSDVSGGILRAAEFLNASAAEHKWLVIQSDLSPWGPQQSGELKLHGFDVVVVFWDCREARSCAARKDEVTARFLAAGAASVTFYGPSASRLVTNIPGGAK